tara:strand:+ start:364 stop:777 length:414 start_codon:yes stop_codon:yes gene_type:complete
MAKTKNYVKRDLVNLMQGLLQVENLKGVKFALANAKNKQIITTALKDIEEKAVPTEEFQALAQEMQKFNMETEADKIKEKEAEPANVKIIEERKAQMAEVDKLLEDSIELELVTLSESQLPKDINMKQVEAIQLIIK